MYQELNYATVLENSRRANWDLEDVIGAQPMDFARPFLPESFARVRPLTFLSADEQLTLNHVRAHGYLAMFELVERCILPFIGEHAPSGDGDEAWRTPALEQFAAEELKHIELFVRFRREFTDRFGSECGFIGPAEEIGAAIRDHSPLGMAIFVLAIELATLVHYLESVRDDQALDVQFKSLLKHHWIEESQHAKLDAMLFREIAARCTPDQVAQGFADFLDIGGFIDGGLTQQVELDLAALELAIGRTLPAEQCAQFRSEQLQAMRWTFLGSALTNPRFLDEIGAVSREARAQIESVAPMFC
jgi:hypothetical protein